MRKFGIEIEIKSLTLNGYEMSRDEFAIRASRNTDIDLRATGYGHSTSRHWKVTTDASVIGGMEIVSPILQDFNDLEKVVTQLNQHDAKVDRKCGLHVHFDARSLSLATIKNVVKLYIRYEAAIDTIVPDSRRRNNNDYCKGLCSGMFPHQGLTDLFGAIDRANDVVGIANNLNIRGRYFNINLHAFTRHGSIEFRQHSGTSDFNKMRNWVELLSQMINRAERSLDVEARTATLTEMLEELNAPTLINIYAATSPTPITGTRGGTLNWVKASENFGARSPQRRFAMQQIYIAIRQGMDPLGEDARIQIIARLQHTFDLPLKKASFYYYRAKVRFAKLNSQRDVTPAASTFCATWQSVVAFYTARQIELAA